MPAPRKHALTTPFQLRLKALMDARGMGIEKLAMVAGLPRSTPWRALRSKRPTVELVMRLAIALDARPAWLAFGDGEMEP